MELLTVNKKLKAARIGVSIRQRGDRLYLRATLPPRPGETEWKQRDVALGIYANPSGIRRAEAEARKMGALLACKEFDWGSYLSEEKPDRPIAQDLIARFKENYFIRRSPTPASETTWRTEYVSVFNQIPNDAEITPELLMQLVVATPADTRNRIRFCSTLKQLADFAGLDFDPSPLRGDYSPRRVQPRDLPSDKEITEWRERLPHPGWQLVFGLMATYGLRNHEVFHLDLKSLTESPVLSVLDGKTGARRVWACYPEWWDAWHLWDVELLPNCSGRDNSALGGRVTQALKRYGFRNPYNLRHAWAVRTLEFGLPVELAAQQMGHSYAVHVDIYHHWISDQHHQRAFDLLMNRSDRPLPP